ncbi:PREDICTED: polyamine-modulated factor 1-like [Nanorana parkeri]|uniref:polyamine-modulated factor 1-like n=1 Tax=Nanorana parkeri TaxID=125878 RepID=UPI0008544CF2|nr:PREDICTED: polyamine-modulated factor 1-like [Nanorana parkeri]
MEDEAVPSTSRDAAGSEQPEAEEVPGRLLIFNTLVDKFLEGLVETGSYERFARCYKKFYKLQPELTRGIYDQFVAQLHSSIKAEVQEIKEEGNLEALLDSLDRMEKDSAAMTDLQWRPSGVPEEDVRDHLVPYLLQQREYLRKLVAERERENAKLARSVLAGRKKIEEMQQEIQRRQQVWQKLSKSQRDLILSIQGPEKA